MYIAVKEAPTSEQIKQFHTRVVEEDSYIDYTVDFSQFDDTLRKAFIEAFKVDPVKIEGIQSVTLTQLVEK